MSGQTWWWSMRRVVWQLCRNAVWGQETGPPVEGDLTKRMPWPCNPKIEEWRHVKLNEMVDFNVQVAFPGASGCGQPSKNRRNRDCQKIVWHSERVRVFHNLRILWACFWRIVWWPSGFLLLIVTAVEFPMFNFWHVFHKNGVQKFSHRNTRLSCLHANLCSLHFQEAMWRSVFVPHFLKLRK